MPEDDVPDPDVPGAGTSRSALLVALARTHLTWMGVIDDPCARELLPGTLRWRLAVAALRLPGLGALGRSPTFAYLAGRTCFFDDVVADSLDRGIDQVVVLGAGYDSRSWRFARPGVTFFEVDRPATQSAKRARAPAGGPVYVAADVTDPSLADRLCGAGFRRGRPTVFTAEGLTMYLTGDQVARLLCTLAGLGGPGSRLAVNFGVGFERRDSGRGRLGRRVMERGGEEFRFRLDLADAPEFVTGAGWATERTCTGPQLRDTYLAGTRLAAVEVTSSGCAVEAAIP